ncbi:heme ABC transporter ATP-binding protein [Marinobacter zhejiangensis]|uniref:Iron complex transport system ATP-binding protein n=1 Tax=Marinobacter zhejiangensis TaxID=488535 RepID=A0A1I4TNI3_9GAMM|nr:heme ABC transporter ATP-binding protein [Marinobacter zhejiangensis]SFM78328.1 iron complex transport system ATP-binding protein [Marinobacter zhejiangensis]
MAFDSGAVLDVSDVSFRVGRQAVLTQVSLRVERGEFVALLGPNGAGKSSLLRVVSGECRPESGQVRIAGRALASWRRRDLARHRAVMPQKVDVSFPFTAREVVALGCPADRVTGRQALIDSLLSRLGVADLADRLIGSLSGGEQQRVQLARVLAQVCDSDGPRLLLLDECTSALDPAQQQLVFSLLRELASVEGYAIVAVVHDLNLAAAHADRLVMMCKGRVVADGPPLMVLAPDLLRQVYGLNSRVERLPEGYPVVVPLVGGHYSQEMAEPVSSQRCPRIPQTALSR